MSEQAAKNSKFQLEIDGMPVEDLLVYEAQFNDQTGGSSGTTFNQGDKQKHVSDPGSEKGSPEMSFSIAHNDKSEKVFEWVNNSIGLSNEQKDKYRVIYTALDGNNKPIGKKQVITQAFPHHKGGSGGKTDDDGYTLIKITLKGADRDTD